MKSLHNFLVNNRVTNAKTGFAKSIEELNTEAYVKLSLDEFIILAKIDKVQNNDLWVGWTVAYDMDADDLDDDHTYNTTEPFRFCSLEDIDDLYDFEAPTQADKEFCQKAEQKITKPMINKWVKTCSAEYN